MSAITGSPANITKGDVTYTDFAAVPDAPTDIVNYFYLLIILFLNCLRFARLKTILNKSPLNLTSLFLVFFARLTLYFFF